MMCTLESEDSLKSDYVHQVGDALVFMSHKFHCAQPVLRGTREVFILELWDGEHRKCAHRCDQRTGACEFSIDARASLALACRRAEISQMNEQLNSTLR